MAHHYLAQSRIKLILAEAIGKGGEGTVYRTSQSGLVAKVFHRDRMHPDTFAKLDIMIRNPPDEVHKHKNKPSLAWPADMLLDGRNTPCGFVMPSIDQGIELHHIYSPALRKRHAPQFTWYHLLHAAQNICTIVRSIHQKGYVIGDAKQSNILIRPDTTVALIDTDSFQVISPDGKKTYHCKVATPKLCPPELLGVNLAQVRRDASSDLYTLAVILHQLIFGLDPIPNRGKWRGKGKDFPPIDECVRNNYWIHAPNRMIVPSEQSLTLDLLPQDLADLFLRTFNDGHAQPTRRPSADDWRSQLGAALNALDICRKHPHHLYFPDRGGCPWCKRKRKFKSDYFPAPQNPKHRFDANHVSGRRLDQLLGAGEERQAIQYWDQYKLASQAKYTSKSNQIEQLRATLTRWDQFRQAFKDKNATENQLLQLWDVIPQAGQSRTIQSEIRKLPGNPTSMTMRTFLQQAKAARASIEQMINTQKQHGLYRKNKDDELIQAWQALTWDIQQRPWFQHQGHAYFQEAQQRLDKVRMLQDAWANREEQKTSDLWNQHKALLSRIDIIAKERDIYETLSRDMQALRQLRKLARQKHRDYCAMLQIWHASPELHNRLVVKEKPDWSTRTASVKAFMQTEAGPKCTILQQLQKLKSHKPEQEPNPLLIYEKWFAIWQKHQQFIQADPVFERYRRDIEEAKKYIKQLQSVLTVIKQQDSHGLLELWSEQKNAGWYQQWLESKLLIPAAQELIERAFDELIEVGKERQALQKWDHYRPVSLARHVQKSRQMAQLRTTLAQWDKFRHSFKDKNATENQLLQLWDVIPQAEQSRTVQCEVPKLPGNLTAANLRTWLQQARDARTAIEQITNTQKQHDLYRKDKDDELIKIWQSLGQSIRQRPWFQHQAQNRYRQARERLDKVRMLQDAWANREEQKISDLWDQHKAVLSRIDIIAKQRDIYETLSRDMQALRQLRDLVQADCRDYCAIQQLWRANLGLRDRLAVRTKPDWPTQTQSIKAFVEMEVELKCDILQQLKQLKKSGAEQYPDLLTLYEAWFVIEQKYQQMIQTDAAFTPYREDIDKARKHIDQLQSILNAIEQQDGPGLLKLWNEPRDKKLFKHRLQSISLINQAIDLIQQALSQPDSLGRADVKTGHMHIILNWDWPQDGAIEGVKIQVNQIDAEIEEYTWTKTQYQQHQGRITIPLKKNRAMGARLSVHLYPYATFLGKTIQAKTAALNLNLSDPPRFLCQWLPDRENPSAIILHSNRDYPDCLIQLVGNNYRKPLPTDPDNMELKTWRHQNIRANQSVKINITQGARLARHLDLLAYSDAAGTQPITLEESVVRHPSGILT